MNRASANNSDSVASHSSTPCNSIQHTKGKWYVDESIEYQISVISPWSKENDVAHSAVFGDYRGGIICTAHYNTGVPTYEQALANARLIAAAPDMLEALLRIEKYADNLIKKSKDNYTSSMVLQIKQAIKKATS